MPLVNMAAPTRFKICVSCARVHHSLKLSTWRGLLSNCVLSGEGVFSLFLNFSPFLLSFLSQVLQQLSPLHIFSVKVELLQEILWQMPILFDKLFIALVDKRRLVKVVITLFINYSLHKELVVYLLKRMLISSSQTLLDIWFFAQKHELSI